MAGTLFAGLDTRFEKSAGSGVWAEQIRARRCSTRCGRDFRHERSYIQLRFLAVGFRQG
jgi:hypothetical protein